MDLATVAAFASAVISALTFLAYRKDKRFELLSKRMDASEEGADERFWKLEDKIDGNTAILEMNITQEIIKLEHNSNRHLENHLHRINERLERMGKDLSEIKDRLTFLEAFMFFNEEVAAPQTRSESAKKMWQRRRGKQIEDQG